MDCSTIVVIGNTGDGKSTLLNVLSGNDQTFAEGIGSNSVTQKTEVKHCHFQGSGPEVILCDTQGISDSEGLDNNNIQQMVEELKKLNYLNMVTIVINGTNVRFSAYVQETVKLFVNIFSADVLKHLSIVFTHWDVTQRGPEDEKRIETEYNDKLKKMFNCTTAVPCFFVDSCFDRVNLRGKYSYETDDRNLYNARFKNFYATSLAMEKLETKKLEAADRHIANVRIETRTMELSRIVTPIYETHKTRRRGIRGQIHIDGSRFQEQNVHVGNRTVINFCKQQREVKTLYNGQEVFGDWISVETWSATA